MMLLEHDAKEFAATRDIPVPRGVFLSDGASATAESLGKGPWVVKGQAAVGGRGKAGAIRRAGSVAEVAEIVAALTGMRIKGHLVHGCRVEQQVKFTHEVYLSFMVDAAERGIRVMLSAEGGVDIEAAAHREGAMRTAVAPPERAALTVAALGLADGLPAPVAAALENAIPRLARLFLDSEAMLLEINPLFVLQGGGWVAGDCKLSIDENVLGRQPDLKAIVLGRPDAYREAVFKLTHGFDCVTIDPNGQIGLLTTGAGLSMMLIDEMLNAGRKPFNFCDVRSGLLRGSPERLIQVLKLFVQGPNLKAVLVNIFAGITDLEEFARLLLEALDAVPTLTVPVVARLIGNNFEAARKLIESSGRPVTVEMDLDRAMSLVLAKAGAAR